MKHFFCPLILEEWKMEAKLVSCRRPLCGALAVGMLVVGCQHLSLRTGFMVEQLEAFQIPEASVLQSYIEATRANALEHYFVVVQRPKCGVNK